MASRATWQVDPDSEIITATAVTPGKPGDASVASDLIADFSLIDDTGAAGHRRARAPRRRMPAPRNETTSRLSTRPMPMGRENAGTPRPSRHHLALHRPSK